MKKDDAKRVLDLVAKAANQRKASRNEGVANDVWPFGFSDVVVDAAIELPNEIPTWERAGLVAAALFSLNAETELTAERIAHQVAVEARKLLDRKEERFMLVTKLSVMEPPNPITRTLEGVTIRIGGASKAHRASLEKDPNNATYFGNPNLLGWTTLTAKTKAKSVAQAYQRAMRSVNAFRGILNHKLVGDLITSDAAGPPKPISKVRIGPVQHVYSYPNGPLSNLTWLELRHNVNTERTCPKGGWPTLLRYHDSVVSRIRRTRLCPNIIDWFGLYSEALDQADHVAAFQRLWTLLELMTGSSFNSDGIIRRALFTFEEHNDFSRAVLLSARSLRNEIVHTSHQPDRARALVCALKPFVERLLHFFVVMSTTVDSIQDAHRILDLPRARTELTSEIEARRLAIRLRAGMRMRRRSRKQRSS